MNVYYPVPFLLRRKTFTQRMLDAFWHSHLAARSDHGSYVSFCRFVNTIINRSHASEGILEVALIYLLRVEHRSSGYMLDISLPPQIIFLAMLIIASKSHYDQSPRNSTWASYTRAYSGASGYTLDDVNFAERQMLTLLAWDTCVSELDLRQLLRALMTDGHQK